MGRIGRRFLALAFVAVTLAGCNGGIQCGPVLAALQLQTTANDLAARYPTMGRAVTDGFLPSHAYVSFAGMGVTMFQPADLADGVFNTTNRTPDLLEPNLLFYSPGPAPGPNPNPLVAGGFTDLYPDAPYTLIGWGYAQSFAPGQRPVLGCIDPAAWFVHEAGWHLSNGGYTATPPPGETPATLGTMTINAPPGLPPVTINPPTLGLIWHPRFWDLHVWINGANVPALGIFNNGAGGPAAGAALPGNAFF